MTQSEIDETERNDPSRITLPYIDTSNEIFGPFNIRETAMLTPGAAILLGGLFVWISRGILTSLPLMLVGILATLAGAQIGIGTRWYNSPRERLENVVDYFRLRRSLPWDHEELEQEREHGVRRIFADGTAEMDDGRLVGLVRLEGRNTYKMSESDRGQLTYQLARAVDEEIRDFGFRFHSTTRRPDPSNLMETYEDRALDDLTDEDEKYGKELLLDLADWYSSVDEESWDSRDWHHYIAVDVSPADVKRDLERSDVGSSGLLSWLSPFSGGSKTEDRRRRRLMQQELDDRLSTIESNVVSPVEGIDGERVTPDEHACLLLSFWTGEEYSLDDELHHAFKRTHTGPSVWPHENKFKNPDVAEEPDWKDDEIGNKAVKDRINGSREPARAAADGGTDVQSGGTQAFSPGHFDAHRGYVEVGDQYCKTYWIAEWPVAPESLFLENLFTMRGIDLHTTFHFEPEPKRETIEELANDRAAIGAEESERHEEGDITAADIETDSDAYHMYYEMLRSSSSQSWRANGYITVRAGSLKALEDFDDQAQQMSSLDGAKMDTLRESSDRVHKTLTGAPADMLPIPPTTRQREAFASCSPTGRDRYNEATRVDKSTRVLGGVIGALFPPCTGTVQEDGGMDWGRNEHNGSLIRADPFDRGAAPHIITIGQSRSGKTYGSTKAALRWWLEEDDRTLIVCDTQSGFDGLTKLCDGKHIVVDGSQTINPLDIQPVPEYMRESAGGQIDPYRMKVDEAAQFFAGILRSQGVKPGEFMSTIEEALETTYSRAEIYPHDLESHANPSPTVEDFLETLGDMLENPEQFTHTGHEAEAAEKIQHASQLLDYLSGFRDGGKYSHLVGETQTGLADPDVDMAYLDLQQFKGQSDAERSAMLQLMLGQVSQKIKRAPGECVFMIDEAHFLLHSDEMSSWLEKAAREWARYQACMWFISQHPAEFVSDEGSDSSKDKITAQCSTVQLYRTPKVEIETLRKFGLNNAQAREVKEQLTTGKSGRGFSECLMQFQDREGWFPTYVEAAPFEDLVINYSPREHGEFDEYLESNWGGF